MGHFKKLKQEQIGDFWVSTVQLPEWHKELHGEPCHCEGSDAWYETMVFNAPNGDIDFREIWKETQPCENMAFISHERGVEFARTQESEQHISDDDERAIIWKQIATALYFSRDNDELWESTSKAFIEQCAYEIVNIEVCDE